MSNIPMKPRILALLRFSHQQVQQFVEGLSDAERNAEGSEDCWSAKDFLVNILLWQQLQTQKLAIAVRGEIPPDWCDMQVVHQLNDEAFDHYRNCTFQTVLEEFERIYHAFIAQVESMSEEELSDPEHYNWQEGEPLWEETLGNGLWHPCSQLTAFYLQRGDKQAALQLQETLLEEARKAELPPETLGVTMYNQACLYVKNGWSAKAIPLLSEALHLRPTLVEWARHDADLNALRTEPSFQAIFQDPGLIENAPVSDLISPQELHVLRNAAPLPLVIDVRGSSEYVAGHVQGAINIPLGQLSRKLKQIPRDQLTVTYCNMHHRGESRGERAALLLREQGYDARTIDGGYHAWQEAGLPVEAAQQV